MILDPSGRYIAVGRSETLLRYDRRWRRSRVSGRVEASVVEILEGNGFLLVVACNETGRRVEASVRAATRPESPVAVGTFDEGAWKFAGDAQTWAFVPEYLTVPDGDGRFGLLRVADGAVTDPLEGVGIVRSTVVIPGTRLCVLAGEGLLTVYDPEAKRVGISTRLSANNPCPLLRFHPLTEDLWVDDIGSMLRLDSKTWEVIDAAGTDTGEGGEAPDAFGRWSFADEGRFCVVPRPAHSDVLVLDTETMLPVAQVQTEGRPSDALLDRGVLFTFEDGKVCRHGVRLPSREEG